jgi:hypothetical protein
VLTVSWEDKFSNPACSGLRRLVLSAACQTSSRGYPVNLPSVVDDRRGTSCSSPPACSRLRRLAKQRDVLFVSLSWFQKQGNKKNVPLFPLFPPKDLEPFSFRRYSYHLVCVTDLVIVLATWRRRPFYPAKSGERRGTSDRTSRACHRPWMGD